MTWTVIWSKRAEKQLDALPKEVAIRILKKTDDIQADPFAYFERLSNSHLYKFRVGNYRIIVDVINDKMILHFVLVKKRSRVYD
jgi:mRNA-degrading endonuclease RelE of RelBE toxin-antitoxin system